MANTDKKGPGAVPPGQSRGGHPPWSPLSPAPADAIAALVAADLTDNCLISERASVSVPTLRRSRAQDRDHGYPGALFRWRPPDQTMVLPSGHYRALRRAASRVESPAAQDSLRQALLLHEDPAEAPPTWIELELSEAEKRELAGYLEARGTQGSLGDDVSLDRMP